MAHYSPKPRLAQDTHVPYGRVRRGDNDSYIPSYRRRSTSRSPERRKRHDARTWLRHKDDPISPNYRSAISKRKSKSERKNNPSTRIHSIKKQLENPDLPGILRQERERELAALLVDQQQTTQQNIAKQNLSRYHFVRFVERQKAERILKQLVKQKSLSSYRDFDPTKRAELDRQIHFAEVDVCYAKNAPLANKYISLFPQDKKYERKGQQKADETASIVKNASGMKPPMWYEIEKAMEKGQAAVEAIRDRKLSIARKIVAVGGKDDARSRELEGQALEDEATPDWLKDDGMIDPEDLDSDDNQVQVDGDGDGDEEMADGGFFEAS
jgi:hypothetical protein